MAFVCLHTANTKADLSSRSRPLTSLLVQVWGNVTQNMALHMHTRSSISARYRTLSSARRITKFPSTRLFEDHFFCILYEKAWPFSFKLKPKLTTCQQFTHHRWKPASRCTPLYSPNPCNHGDAQKPSIISHTQDMLYRILSTKSHPDSTCIATEPKLTFCWLLLWQSFSSKHIFCNSLKLHATNWVYIPCFINQHHAGIENEHLIRNQLYKCVWRMYIHVMVRKKFVSLSALHRL